MGEGEDWELCKYSYSFIFGFLISYEKDKSVHVHTCLSEPHLALYKSEFGIAYLIKWCIFKFKLPFNFDEYYYNNLCIRNCMFQNIFMYAFS